LFRFFLSISILASFALAVPLLLLTGCGSARSTAGSNGSGPVGGSGIDTNAVCGGPGYGYNNQTPIGGVWMQSPKPGENPATVQVNAVAAGSATVTKWAVCLDGQPAYQNSTGGSSVSTQITMTPGQHLLFARAFDAQGDTDRSEIALVTVGTPPPSSTTLPTPPANATVLTEMQNDTGNWSICSLCAAGTHDTGNYWMKPDQSTPSLSGSSMEMYADGPSWSNVLFMDIMPGTQSATHFLWDFEVYHDPAAEAHFWSSEFDLWQVLNGQEFMIGSQCDFGDGYWSTWDSQGGSWILNGIPCPHWTPGWHHVQWYVERTGPTQYRYDTLVFDSTPYGLNQTWNSNTTTWQDMVGIQFQLDQDPTGTPLHEWVDKVTLTEW
jgi:hypothetical protein